MYLAKESFLFGGGSFFSIWYCLFVAIAAVIICFLPGEVSVSFYSIVIIAWTMKFFINPYSTLIMAKEEDVWTGTVKDYFNIFLGLLCVIGTLFLVTYTTRIHLIKGTISLFVFCVQFGFIAMLLFYFSHGKYQKKINWIGYGIGFPF